MSLVNPEQIIEATAARFRMSISSIRGGDRHKTPARARHIAMHITHMLLPGMSFPEIGGAFGVDHSTVMSACRKVAAQQDEATLEHIRVIIAMLSAPAPRFDPLPPAPDIDDWPWELAYG